MSDTEIEINCAYILDTTHTLNDCVDAFDRLKNMLQLGVSDYGFSLIQRNFTMLMSIKSAMFSVGEAKYNYQKMLIKLDGTLIPIERASIIESTEEMFSVKFPNSMYGMLLIDMLTTEKAKLN